MNLQVLKTQLDREKTRLATATAANKPKYAASVDELTKKIAGLETSLAAANKELDRAFVEYNKALNFKRTDPNAPLTHRKEPL